MKKILGTFAASALAVGLSAAAPSLAAPAAAAPAATVTVTIVASVEPSGTVRSALRRCKANVTVKLFRQVGTRGGGDDIAMNTDGTSLQNGKWTYNLGQPGLHSGNRIYTKVLRPRDGCRRAASPTVTIP